MRRNGVEAGTMVSRILKFSSKNY